MYEEYLRFTVTTGFSISALWVVGFVLSWIVQWSWSGVDDTIVEGGSWLWGNINLCKFRYPIFNNDNNGSREDFKRGKKPFGYSKNKSDEGGSCWEVNDKDQVYPWEAPMMIGGQIQVVFFTSLSPFIILTSITLYPLTIGIATTLSIAYLARFVRRHKKLFDKHIVDKEAHK